MRSCPAPRRRGDTEAFERSLTSVSPATREAYGRDIASFVEWAERAVARPGLSGSSAPRCAATSRTSSTRRYAPRTIARARLGAAAVLRVARAHRPHRRPTRRRACTRPRASPGCRACCAATSCTVLLDEPPAAVDGDDDAIRLRDDAVLELLYGSGLRVAELCGLGPSDLDLRTPARSRSGARASKQRRVPMSEPAVEAVAGWLARGPRAGLVREATPRPTPCS